MVEDAKGAVEELLALLDLERLEENLFRGRTGAVGFRHVFGGQVLAQALVAGIRSVQPERQIHSLHGYFILPGDRAVPIVYEVENLRDGGSFSTRRVKAIQHGRVIFVMVASFHKQEAGLDHAVEMPKVPPPSRLKDARELFTSQLASLPESMQRFWTRFLPIEFRPVDISRYLDRTQREPVQHIWLKCVDTLPDKAEIHAGILAYASDFALIETALAPHGKLLSDSDVRLVSLDHALWFHRPARIDEWLLYSLDSPSSAGARGFCRGQIFREDGILVASTAQEGLMRIG
jgi:acyl-CoA thioesterase II